MALKLKASGNSEDFKRCPAGSHIAVCNLVADMGLQPGSGLYPAPKQKVYLRFEVPAERVSYEKDGHAAEGPQVIGVALTASMHEKATLRVFLEGWRGRKFTDAEAEDFDILSVLGKACMLSVVETQKGDKTYSNIKSIGGLPKGLPKPVAENQLLQYTPEDDKQFDQLPEWLQKKISEQLAPPVKTKPVIPDDFEDDIIPF